MKSISLEPFLQNEQCPYPIPLFFTKHHICIALTYTKTPEPAIHYGNTAVNDPSPFFASRNNAPFTSFLKRAVTRYTLGMHPTHRVQVNPSVVI